MTCPLNLAKSYCPECYWKDPTGCAFGRTCDYCGHVTEPDDPVLSYFSGHQSGCQTPAHQVSCASIDKCLERQLRKVAV